MAVKKENKVQRVLLAILRYLVAIVSVAILFYVLFALIFSTEEEKHLERENRLYKERYQAMRVQEGLIGDVVEGLLDKDEAIYQELFETQPPFPDQIRSTISDNEALPERYYVTTASARSDTLMAKASRIDQNFSEIFRILQERPDSIPPLSLPLKDMSYVQVGASVGLKHNSLYNLQIQHNGLDLVAPQGAKVYAAAGGKVSSVTRSRKGLGNVVTIDHGNGYETRYALLGDISVTSGRNIRVGTVIGTVGVSTFVTAPHLHFEVRYKGEVKDPIDFFFASVSPEEYSLMRNMAAKTSQSMD